MTVQMYLHPTELIICVLGCTLYLAPECNMWPHNGPCFRKILEPPLVEHHLDGCIL